MDKQKYIEGIKLRIKGYERDKRIYPGFSEIANDLIKQLKSELITFNHFEGINNLRPE